MLDFAQELGLQIPRLRRYARALTHNAAWADDLVQDTLERALRRRWLFKMHSNLIAWLMTILYRLYLNDASRHQKMHTVTEHDAAEAAMHGDIAWQLDIQRALVQLSAEHRAVIVLIGLEQASYQETATILDVPLGTVMSRLARARRQLRAMLAGQSVADTPPHLTRVK